MTEKRILHLTLKRKWFDMIASGEKKEEYRESKPYWQNRFYDYLANPEPELKQFDEVHFKNGYSKNAPFMRVECKGTYIGMGAPKWGAEYYKQYYIIKLGNILEIKNH